MRLYKRTAKAWTLLNQTPIDGCLLVFNGCHADFRAKASDFKKKHNIALSVSAINKTSRELANSRTAVNDLYITFKSIGG